MEDASTRRFTEEHVGLATLYAESAATFRHYSNCSLTIRLSVIIQGMAILSASGYLLLRQRFFYSFAAAMFGLYFTAVLFAVYWAYDAACGAFQANLSRLEQLGAEGGRVDEEAAPFTSFGAMRDKRYRSFLVRVLTLYGAFTSVGLAFLVLLVFSATARLME